MQATDPFITGSSFVGQEGIERLRGRIGELRGEIEKQHLAAIEAALGDPSKSPEEHRDSVSTRLMEAFRQARSRACFGLLYELNGNHLLGQVVSRLRRYSSKADPGDVLQEVFFNIYRYPHRFNPARDDAFRVWSAMIVRNTVLKHLRSLSRGGRSELAIDELPDQASDRGENPLSGAIESESKNECARVYLTYLQLYLRFYAMLSERERRALYLVEVDGESYRHAAGELGIKLENLKMVIFRARKKIHRSMRRVFDGLAPDCRPARAPRGEEEGDLETSEALLDARGGIRPRDEKGVEEEA